MFEEAHYLLYCAAGRLNVLNVWVSFIVNYVILISKDCSSPLLKVVILAALNFSCCVRLVTVCRSITA